MHQKLNAKLSKAKDSHGKDCDGNNLLSAAKKGDIENVKTLLEMNMSLLEFTDNDGDSVLNNAAWKGSLAVVKFLMDKGARLVHKNKIELNALHHASCKGKHETCRYLIEKGIDVNSRTKKGTTPLIMASRNGQLDTVKVLLEMGADIYAKDHSSNTVLKAAMERNQKETVSFLKMYKQKGEVLMLATKRGDLDEVQRMVKSDAPVEFRDEDFDSVLNNAAWTGNTDVLSLLVSLGARLESPNQNNLTALHHAAYKGHYHTVKWLIKTGCNVNAKSNLGNTPLIMAAKNGLTNTCRTLVELGAEINAVNNDGENAYDAAKRNLKYKTYDFLRRVISSPSIQAHCNIEEGKTVSTNQDQPPLLVGVKRADVLNPILMAARSVQMTGTDDGPGSLNGT